MWTVMCHSSAGGELPFPGTCTPMYHCFVPWLFPKNELIRINLSNKTNKTLASVQGNLSIAVTDQASTNAKS